MKFFSTAGVAFVFAGMAFSQARETPSPARAPRIYIEPQEQGFESYIATAILKKHVPAVVTAKKDEAQYILTDVARSRGVGAYGYSRATVQLIDARTQEVVWSYYVRKYFAGAQPSEAEAIAKHLKDFLEKHPQ